MRISRIYIENFRSLRRLDLELPQVCCLVGPNNAGKSNILLAIQRVLGRDWVSVTSFEEQDVYAHDSNADVSIQISFEPEIPFTKFKGSAPVGVKTLSFDYTRYKIGEEKGKRRLEQKCYDENGKIKFVEVDGRREIMGGTEDPNVGQVLIKAEFEDLDGEGWFVPLVNLANTHKRVFARYWWASGANLPRFTPRNRQGKARWSFRNEGGIMSVADMFSDFLAKLTELFNRLKALYFNVKASEKADLLEFERQLQAIEDEYSKVGMSDQMLFSGWMAHYKFFWEHQIDWVDEQKHFRFFRDKLPLSFTVSVTLFALATIAAAAIYWWHCR